MHLTKTLAITVLSLCPLLAAQGGTPQVQDGKLRVLREVIEKRDQMREGKVVRTNVRVNVRLKNGNRIVGVVKAEQFVERLDGLDFVPTQVLTKDAGLRIWYFDHTNSYVFIPYAEIQDYRISNRLSDVQLKELEQQMAAEAKRNEELRQQRIAKHKLDQARRAEDEKAEEEKLLKLLEDFPPEKGWSDQRVADIKSREITIGVPPTPEEKRFVESFPHWVRALELKQRLDAEKAESQKPATPPTPAK
jgi:hypothetical protein